MDARTSAMLDQCQQLLWVLRKDSATANVEIIVRDMNPTSEQNEEQHRSEGVSCKARKTEVSHHTGDDKDSSARSRSYSRGGSRSVHRPGGSGNNETGSTVCEDILQVRGVVFRAHKCILESAPFFTRMLSGVFREAQEDEDGKYRIELSNDMFNVEIMEHLLDYLYTREPISNEIAPSYAHGPHHLSPTGILSSSSASNEPQVRHIISANVGLNLETIVTETRNPPGLYRHRSHHQYLLPTASLTLWHWGALYRAAMHLEDKELQAHSLHQIQAHLDPESTLEQVLTWGHQHAEVKSVMLEYLIKKRREVFGDEQRSKLRPYLWAEYEEQVETLVEITSQLARQ
ncbi:hypothetical protein BGZ54_000998 [Gamsiella multidivaricata]|nr:hypothetical protein BGZ54_000998 [Gamsiella multidivaricata]